MRHVLVSLGLGKSSVAHENSEQVDAYDQIRPKIRLYLPQDEIAEFSRKNNACRLCLTLYHRRKASAWTINIVNFNRLEGRLRSYGAKETLGRRIGA